MLFNISWKSLCMHKRSLYTWWWTTARERARQVRPQLAFVYCSEMLVKILITGQNPQHLSQAKFLYAWPDTHVQRDSCGSIWGTICVSAACAYVCACQHTLIFNLVDSLASTYFLLSPLRRENKQLIHKPQLSSTHMWCFCYYYKTCKVW